MSNLEKTRRLERIVLDTDENNFATLIVLQNQQVYTSAVLDSLITSIGRDPECTISLAHDGEASRQHAQRILEQFRAGATCEVDAAGGTDQAPA